MTAVGVDGCRGGWLAAWIERGRFVWRVFPSFAQVLAAFPGAVTGVDMPVGLPDSGSRAADTLARRLLGAPRASSVFTPPLRPLLAARNDYGEANRLSRALAGRGVSRQAFHLYPKIVELDAVITPALQDRVREVHPELAFLAMSGSVNRLSKRTPDGYRERARKLRAAFPSVRVPAREEARTPGARPDDVLDALAVYWTARRVPGGSAVSLPPEPELDRRALRMEIVY